MSVADWFQAISLVVVAAALLLSVWQTRELVRQTGAVTASLQQSAYHAMVNQTTAFRVSFLKQDPNLLALHLKGRGFDKASPEENLRRLYILVRLEMHELNFVSYSQGLLSRDVWSGWHNTLLADFATPEFQQAWELVKILYAPSFVGFVDGAMADLVPVTAGSEDPLSPGAKTASDPAPSEPVGADRTDR